jgi:hypothetical protein
MKRAAIPGMLEIPNVPASGSPIAIPNPFVEQGRVLGWAGSLARGYNGALQIFIQEEEIVVAAAASSTSVNAALLAGPGLIIAVLYRVNATIPTITSFAITDATNTGRFATGISPTAPGAGVAGGVGFLHWNPTNTDALGPRQTANSAIRLVMTGSNPANNSGRVLVQVVQALFAAPTS